MSPKILYVGECNTLLHDARHGNITKPRQILAALHRVQKARRSLDACTRILLTLSHHPRGCAVRRAKDQVYAHVEACSHGKWRAADMC